MNNVGPSRVISGELADFESSRNIRTRRHAQKSKGKEVLSFICLCLPCHGDRLCVFVLKIRSDRLVLILNTIINAI